MKLIQYLINEKAKPSAGMTKKEKSALVKKAKAGKDIGEPGKKFKEVAKKAAKRYGSKETGKRVAAAAMWKKVAHEGVDYDADDILDFVDMICEIEDECELEGEDYLEEKWAKPAKIHGKGKYEDVGLKELRSKLATIKKSGPHKKGSKEYGKMKELMFAVRAKTGWKEV